MNGIINVLKPPGMTSHDVVSFVRKTINIKRVGHTGTLDPNAAGVLPICIGKATRVVQYFDDFKKVYRAELTLGFETDTQDRYGEIVGRSKLSSFTIKDEDIEKVFEKFKGNISQIPPMYSAIKHNGRKLYELAREGKIVERKPREIYIYDIYVINKLDNKKIFFEAECSKGTYIRTLCNDIGRELGTLGCMTFLLRTHVGDFDIDSAFTVEEIQEYANTNSIDKIILPIDTALKHLGSLNLDISYYNILKNGGKVRLDNYSQSLSYSDYQKGIRIYCDDVFIGVGKIDKTDNVITLKMDKVFI